jgi:uncharacterized membrane protein
MPIILYNDGWMLYNCYLALLAVAFGLVFFVVKGKFLQFLFGFLWLIFLPNTIYIFTDLEHLISEWNQVQAHLHVLLLTQYLLFEIVGILTFLYAFLPFEKILKRVRSFRKIKIPVIFVFNFLIAFGMVLGRVERINSWQIVTAPTKVAISAVHVFFSYDLLGLTLLFGLLCNFVYFLFRDPLIRGVNNVFHILD